MNPTLSSRYASGNDLGGAVSFRGGLSDVWGVEGCSEKMEGATPTSCDLVFTEGKRRPTSSGSVTTRRTAPARRTRTARTR